MIITVGKKYKLLGGFYSNVITYNQDEETRKKFPFKDLNNDFEVLYTKTGNCFLKEDLKIHLIKYDVFQILDSIEIKNNTFYVDKNGNIIMVLTYVQELKHLYGPIFLCKDKFNNERFFTKNGFDINDGSQLIKIANGLEILNFQQESQKYTINSH